MMMTSRFIERRAVLPAVSGMRRPQGQEDTSAV
jgi:hypothetical protein